MDAGMLEVLRLLQAGPFTAATLTEVQVMLGSPGALGANLDRSELHALLDGFSESANDPTVAARAQCLLARVHLDASEVPEAIECYSVALERDPLCDTAAQSLMNLLGRGDQAVRLAALLAGRVQSLRALSQVDDERVAAAYRSLAQVKLGKLGDLDGAIAAYDQAIDFDPDMETIETLAGLYRKRGRPEDEEQAADLYFGIAEALSEDQAIEYLEHALDVMPDHAEAMERLEELVPVEQQFGRLRERWSRYIERAGDDPDADERRVLLSRAHAANGRYRDALLCIAPAADRGDVTAQALREAYVTNLEGDVEAGGGHRSPASPALPPHRVLRARSGQTQLGIDLSEHIGKGVGPEAAALEEAVEAAKQQAAKRKHGGGAPSPVPPPPRSVQAGAGGAVASGPGSGPGASHAPPMPSSAPAPPPPPSLPPSVPAGAPSAPPPGVSPGASVAPSGDLASGAPRARRARGLRAVAAAGACVLGLAGIGFAAFRSPSPEVDAAAMAAAAERRAAVAQAEREEAEAAQEAREKRRAAKRRALAARKRAARKAAAKRAAAAAPNVRIIRKAARFRGARINRRSFFSRVQKAVPQLTRCYEKALERDRKLAGRIVYGVVINRAGRTTSLERVSGSLEDANLGACGRAVLRSVRFPRPSERKTARIRLSVSFDT